MAKRKTTGIRGGRLLDVAKHRAEPADILITGDTILEIGRPGMAAPADATVIDANRRLLHPGLVNAHTHGHGNLAKGMGDRWTLEQIGRAHVRTPVTNAHLVCRLLLAKTKK